MRNKEQDIPGTADYNGDALTEHYHNAEMAKLTDSEAEFVPADDEWQQKSKTTHPGTKDDRLQDFFDTAFSDCDSGCFFTDEEDDKVLKAQGLKLHRDLAEG